MIEKDQLVDDELLDDLEEFPPLAAGDVVAPGYEVISHLHRSNNFDVYDAWSDERACRCIAKIPCPDLLDDTRTARRLLREGRRLKGFSHPHLVRLYESLREPQPTLILETITGETLAHLIHRSKRRLPTSDVIYLGLHLCSAIHYLHRQGILHLDLKPSNIVSERGLAKVLDLSIAQPPGRSRKGAGTDQYMSPEQARGEPVDEAADVWGIGTVLYEATTFKAAFDLHEHEDEYVQLERRAEPIRTHRRLPAALASAIDACLEPDPARRPTVDGLMESLNALT
ncbi:MAG TPA: serine/threonine-protein kinase [Rubrobacteraceae bacterium]|nr:serine/threonine-protein kinase [Rubrobacteraceae bacterium]